MTPRNFALPLAAFLFICAPLAAHAQALPPHAPACKPGQLSFNTDNENGAFSGMSHSGTLLVLRNLGPDACSVPARPVVVFEDAAHHTLPSGIRVPRGMHPGPVILPVVIPVGAEVTSRMRWVSGDAYGANNGISPAFITLRINGQILSRKFSGKLFGPAGKHPEYSASFFTLDPPYLQPCQSKAVKNAAASNQKRDKHNQTASAGWHWLW